MDGWTDQWMDEQCISNEQVDGWMEDGWTDEWMDGQINGQWMYRQMVKVVVC